MTDQSERWRNVCQAAQWLAEGREVECRWGNSIHRRNDEPEWRACKSETPGYVYTLRPDCEYRLKPEPPKPREWELRVGQWGVTAILVEGGAGPLGEVIRVREVLP